MPGDTNPFLDYLDILNAEPKFAYFAKQGEFGRAPVQRRYFQNQFTDFYNEYLGRLGQSLKGGQMPDLSFSNWLEQPEQNFQSRFQALAPWLRGQGTGMFNPSTRFIPF